MKHPSSKVALLFAGALAACDENPDGDLQYGSVELTATSEAASAPIATADGWSLTHRKLLVSFSAATVAGRGGVVTAAGDPQIFDLVQPGPHVLVRSGLRLAGAWDDVSFQIGPATVESSVADLAAEDATAMTDGGLSILLESTATKADVTKTLRWGFSTDTLYAACEGTVGGAAVKGLVVPPNGGDAANIVVSSSVLFGDKLDGTGQLTFDAIANADADGDGAVTLDEIAAVSLEDARAHGASYDVGPDAAVTDLGAFVTALTARLATSFREGGSCTPEPIVEAP